MIDLDAIEARANAASDGPWRLHSWEDNDGTGHITIETARAGGLGDMIADVQVSRLPEIRRAEEGAPTAPLPPRLAAGLARLNCEDDSIEHELTVDMLVSDAAFIAAARTDVPALVAHVRALHAAVRELAAADAGVHADKPVAGAAFARRAALRALFALVPEVKP